MITTYDEIIKEATEAVEKNLNAGYAVPFLLEIINNQKAEIERLKPFEKKIVASVSENIKQLEYEKAKAIKEFADKLTDRICDKSDESLANPDGSNYFIPDVLDDINNIKKEMVGGAE